MVDFFARSHQGGVSISGRLAPVMSGNLRKERSVFRRLRRITENIPAFTVPREELTVNVLGGTRFPSARIISLKKSFRSSCEFPIPT